MIEASGHAYTCTSLKVRHVTYFAIVRNTSFSSSTAVSSFDITPGHLIIHNRSRNSITCEPSDRGVIQKKGRESDPPVKKMKALEEVAAGA